MACWRVEIRQLWSAMAAWDIETDRGVQLR
jgi:hypothetical protein